MKKTLSTIGAGAACLLLAACGGGGGGGGTGTATPSPTPPVTPAPAPATPTATTFNFTEPSVAFNTNAGGPTIDQPRGAGGGVTVTVTDPKGRSFADLQFDTDQTYRVQFTGPGGTVDRSFRPADVRGVEVRSFSNASGATVATQGALVWQTSGASGEVNRFLFHALTVRGERGHVALTESQNTNGTVRNSTYQPLGEATPPGQMPTTGAATFSGGMLGRFFDGSNNLDGAEFIGTMNASVDFAGRTITGSGQSTGFRSGSTDNRAVQVTFNGAVAGGGFAGSTTVVAVRPTTSITGGAGTFQGRFYGTDSGAATEIGGVFNGAFPNGYRVVGGFVAGR